MKPQFHTTRKPIYNRPFIADSPEYIKLPPQALELEETVLGAVLIETSAINEVNIILHEECFYSEAHKNIWKAAIALNREFQPIDLLTVSQRLRSNGELESAGGVSYIAYLANRVGSAANVESHALIIKELYIKRRMISLLTKTISGLYLETTDGLNAFDELLTEMEKISGEIIRIQQIEFSDYVLNRVDELRQAAESRKYKTGLLSHLDAFDNQTMGFQNSDLIIIAGRPAMGKTSFALDLARNQAKEGNPIGIFSLEMSVMQIVDRFIAAEIDVDLKTVRRGGLRDSEWERLNNSIKPLPACRVLTASLMAGVAT